MKRSLFNVFLVMILSMVYVEASAAGLEGISAYSSGGAIMQTNDLINSGSQLNWSFSNNSSVNVTLLSLQLIDGVTNMEGNLLSVNEFVGAGSTVSYTTTIGILGIHVPVTCRFRYSYDGKEYYTDAVYKESYSPDPTSNIKLTIMATGNGTVTYNGSSIRNGEESFNIRFLGDASISFTPDYGYRIKYVKVNNSDVTSRLSNNQYRISLIMDNTTVQVEFEAIPTNYFTLKYMVDGVTYKTYQLQVGATITPEPWPTKDGYSFSGWSEIPRTMPDHDVIITGTFTLLPISNSSGSCGETVNYSYDKTTQVLTISGRGAFYDYDSDSNKAPWSSYAGEIQKIEIEYGVTSIGYFAFYKCSGITSLSIPVTVGYIGSSAFEDCTSLTSLSLNEGLLDIGGSAFEGCTAIKTLTIPSTVNTISINAFKNCKGITDVYCYAENVPDTHYDTFDATPTENSTLHVPANSVDAYRTSWPWSDFKVIVAIGSGGLEGISAYSSGGAVIQTNDLINSGSKLNWSFSNNSNVNVTLVSMQLIDGVTNMEGNLMSVNEFVGAGSTVSYTTTIGILGIHVPVTCRFRYSYDGKEYYIDAVYKESYSPDPTPDSGTCGETVNYSYEKATQTLTISGRGAIYDYDNGSNKAPWYSYADEIQNIKIESGITSIGYFAFYKCSKVKSLNLPATVGYIGSSAFEDCTSLTSLSLNDGLLSIGGSAFEGCVGLQTLTIPSTINSISINAFKNCKGITDVYCYAETVPDTHFDAFDGTPTEKSTLHVHANSVNSYRTTWPWSDFKEIVSLDGDLDGIMDVKQSDDVRTAYSIRGEKLQSLIKGVNIIKMKDGTVKKVFVK